MTDFFTALAGTKRRSNEWWWLKQGYKKGPNGEWIAPSLVLVRLLSMIQLEDLRFTRRLLIQEPPHFIVLFLKSGLLCCRSVIFFIVFFSYTVTPCRTGLGTVWP